MSKFHSGPNRPDYPNRPNTKRTGEHSEIVFLYRADQRRFAISRPFGDSERYDCILDNRPIPGTRPQPRRRTRPKPTRISQLFRIQVKCTECIRAGAYETRATYSVGKGRAVYTKQDCDFIAAHIVPLDIWYIIPVEVCTPQPMLRFYPHRQAKKMRLEIYREAWHLLDPPLPNPPTITIQACIDDNYPEGYEPEADYIEESNPEDDDSKLP